MDLGNSRLLRQVGVESAFSLRLYMFCKLFHLYILTNGFFYPVLSHLVGR